MKKTLLSLLLIAFVSISLNAQVKSGEINYSIKMKGLPAEQAAMLGEMTMKTIFNKKFVKNEIDMGMGKTTTIQSAKAKTTVTLLNIMGNKMMVETTAEEAEELANQASTDINIRETDVVKNIAGYDCKKTVVTVDGNDVAIYHTKEIKVPAIKNASTNGIDFTLIDGCPLMFTVDQGDISMEFKATNIEAKKVKKTAFTIPDGYEKISMDQLKNMGMGM